MRNWNKTTRIVLRWTHLLVGWLIGVFVYAPMREDDTFVLLMKVVFVPLIVVTGMWMWQQARIRRLYKRLRRGPGAGPRVVPGRRRRGPTLDYGEAGTGEVRAGPGSL